MTRGPRNINAIIFTSSGSKTEIKNPNLKIGRYRYFAIKYRRMNGKISPSVKRMREGRGTNVLMRTTSNDFEI
jgi:hypothetical protein